MLLQEIFINKWITESVWEILWTFVKLQWKDLHILKIRTYHDEFSKSFMKTWSKTCLKTYIRIWFAHFVTFTSAFKHLIKNNKKPKKSKNRKFPVSSTLCFSRPCLFVFFLVSHCHRKNSKWHRKYDGEHISLWYSCRYILVFSLKCKHKLSRTWGLKIGKYIWRKLEIK